jgi:sec-independent protein translocase protein TatB
MFDISFTELMVIGVIALIVIGPERLPKVARTAGQWVGKLNRFVSQVKQDVDRDMRLEELRKMQQEMKDTAQKYEIMANDTLHRVEDTVTEETGQISKVMQAMSTTDGGLAMREYEKLGGEEGTGGGTAQTPAAGVSVAPADAGPGTAPPAALADAQPSAARDDKAQA